MDGQDDSEYSCAPELEDLVALCQALNTEGVRHALIDGFAVILQGFVRATKAIDLLSRRIAREHSAIEAGMAVLPENAVAQIGYDEVEKYQVVRIADEIVVDPEERLGVDSSRAVRGVIEIKLVEVEIPVGTKEQR